MYFIDGKGQKSELRSRRNVVTSHIIQSLNHTTSYLWPRGRRHRHILGGTKVISRNQAHAGPACAWFNKKPF